VDVEEVLLVLHGDVGEGAHGLQSARGRIALALNRPQSQRRQQLLAAEATDLNFFSHGDVFTGAALEMCLVQAFSLCADHQVAVADLALLSANARLERVQRVLSVAKLL
jgi:hypothetical protein